MEKLAPACRWRNDLAGGGYECLSPKLVGTNREVSLSLCADDCPYPDHEGGGLAAVPDGRVCIHQGEPSGETVPCSTCKGNVRVKVFHCGLHTRCVRGQSVPGIRACLSCSDREVQLQSGCPDLLPGIPDPHPWPRLQRPGRQWAHDPQVVAQHVRSFRAMLAADVGQPAICAGTGVIYCGGGKYWPMLCAALRMFRRFSGLPIQIWHRGKDEPVNPLDLAGVENVSFRDATDFEPLRYMSGWEIKSLALLHCGWEKILYLDADAYMVSDPAPLLRQFEGVASLVYWSDFPDHEHAINWAAFGMDGAGAIPCIQGGQLVFDRRRGWKALVVSHWLNQHSDYSYQYGYGDQDMWRVAWSALGEPVHHLGPAAWQSLAFVCRLGGKPSVVHRCQGKLWGEASDTYDFSLPMENEMKALMTAYRDKTADAATVFGSIYAGGVWGPPGSSGAGSCEPEAGEYLKVVNPLLKRLGVRRVVDLGSGDGYIVRQIQCEKVIPVEVYAPLVDRLRSVSPNATVFCLDIDRDRDQLPPGEAALLKDVAQHWPESLIVEWLLWAQRSRRWKYLILTNDFHPGNGPGDCPLGGFRALDSSVYPLAILKHIEERVRFIHKELAVARLY